MPELFRRCRIGLNRGDIQNRRITVCAIIFRSCRRSVAKIKPAGSLPGYPGRIVRCLPAAALSFVEACLTALMNIITRAVIFHIQIASPVPIAVFIILIRILRRHTIRCAVEKLFVSRLFSFKTITHLKPRSAQRKNVSSFAENTNYSRIFLYMHIFKEDLMMLKPDRT